MIKSVLMPITIAIVISSSIVPLASESIAEKNHKYESVKNPLPLPPKRIQDNLESLGDFKITQYTAGFESCGKYPDDPEYGITRSGTTVKENHTIASDWSVLPAGTKVVIEGFGNTIYTVEDIGGLVNGKHIDVYTPDLKAATRWGLRKREVWIVE